MFSSIAIDAGAMCLQVQETFHLAQTRCTTVATGGALMRSCSASAADEAADVESGAGWGGDGGEVVAGAGGGAVSFCCTLLALREG